MSFERDGWSIERGVIGAAELATLRALFSSLIPDSDYAPGHLHELTGLAVHHPGLAALARDRRFGALAARALGARRIQHLQDSLLYKPARVGAVVEWHQDHTYVGFLVPARVLTLRIALDDETESSGCMRVVDGSHTWGPIDSVRALTEGSVASLLPALSAEQRDAVSRARVMELAPGDVTLHHGLTLHGSGPNHRETARRTLILRMFDADCRLDRARLPPGTDAYFPCDDDGHLAPERFSIVHDERDVRGG